MYERDKITVSFIARRKFADTADEIPLTYMAKKEDALDDVSRFITGELTDYRGDNTKTNDIEDMINIFMKLPMFVRKLSTRALKIHPNCT